MINETLLKREPVQVPLWRIVKLVESQTRDESCAYHVIAESAEEYTADEIEVFEQIHGKGLIQEKTYEYI